ncbi:MAG: prepilin-type N-terminal cleavage/methylation domain-containing protein [Nitrospirae bacterium]|nr:prepilin-type N-terminal cleavage/methylation domain-containing protein [Nitrospirota bacterium]
MHKDEKGFTLIELVIVIVVLGIIGVVVSLNLGGLSSIRVNNAVKKMVGDLRYAQQLAIATQSRHGLTIDSLQVYSVHKDTGGVDTDIKDPTNLGNDFIVNFDTYQQGQLTSVRFSSTTPFCGGSVIEFNSIGAPTDTNGTLLACTSSIGFSGSTSTILIEPNTGKLTY